MKMFQPIEVSADRFRAFHVQHHGEDAISSSRLDAVHARSPADPSGGPRDNAV